ncbi:hypothetical protein M430DRAFT_37252 [Amorphotheca resinae ATCC 22711]|uniref:Uncharacterized protein n=1 Tax=Amorphotheca resinae ATCC 22711 TaxID=857342 RepID=A0A2T3AS80_AMORE|nr:hypothetical protein M430DRAFT_37252 [Amorphotheca resinae ATCC 22711]PSS09230.1 hypothetical protein M430DRAFT_37252 [Amorphotheca resinae ATCC 22711]
MSSPVQPSRSFFSSFPFLFLFPAALSLPSSPSTDSRIHRNSIHQWLCRVIHQLFGSASSPAPRSPPTPTPPRYSASKFGGSENRGRRRRDEEARRETINTYSNHLFL